MIRRYSGGGVLCLILMFICVSANADVKMDEKSQVKFAGMLGKMMNLFGGKAAKEGIITTVAVKGDRRMTIADNTGEIVDLNEEKKYEFDLKKKTYKVVTFEQIRKEIEEARQKAEKEAAKSKDKEKAPEMEIEFDVKETGQAKTIIGYDCRQVIMTIRVHEKGKTVEEAGELLLTADMWMAPEVTAGKEVVDFERRYREKVHGTDDAQMLQAMAIYPGMDQALNKMNSQSADLKGTAIQTIMTMENVPSKQLAQQQKQEQQQESSGGGGLFGGLTKRLGGKKKDDEQQADPAKKNAFMTMNVEVLKLATTVAPEDINLPAGLKLKD
ncbi:MAG: hypothetical protein EHM23_05710 [Acidobacteria bacterium]|nr:MAG: hypothetical protein EHM23_05710 [Acidobacteriota bacterium]